MAGGLLQVEIGNPEPGNEADAGAKAATDISDALGVVLNGRFIEWRDARLDKENEWIEALRSYSGQYDATKLTEIGNNRSKIFVHLTRTKTLTAYSRIIDLMLGHGDHWSIDPTPEPELTEETLQALHAMAEQAAPGVDLSGDEIEKVSGFLSREACKKMSRRIKDQLIDARYEHLFKMFALEMCIYGTGIIKGPYIKVQRTQKWSGVPGSAFTLTETEKVVPGLDAPSIWDVYPDPYATSAEDCLGVFERHVVTAQMFRDLVGSPGFDEVAINEVIAESSNGNHEDYQYELDRRRISGVFNTTTTNVRYDLMEYWGQVRGSELAAAGLQISAEQMTMEFQANVWFCGRRTIKVQLNPLRPERLPYQFIPYERVPHQIHGIGVPFQMKDSQSVINASVRVTLDNLGISSGPQYEVNMDLLAPGEDPRVIHPWKAWLREGGDASQKMVHFFQPENVSEGLRTITEQFRAFADEETSLPSYTSGFQTPALNDTASGMSMLMGAANISTKSIIKNIDSYGVEPIITGMYDWNMKWSEDDDIKGDMRVKAMGSTALLAKEIQSQRLIQYANMTNNPEDRALMGPKRIGMLRAVAESMDLDPDKVAPDDPEEAQAQTVAQPVQPGAPMQPAQGMPADGSAPAAQTVMQPPPGQTNG
jgi:hypothetical protein